MGRGRLRPRGTGTRAQGTAQAEAQTGRFWHVPGTARTLGRTPEGEEAVDARKAGREPLDGPHSPRSPRGLEGAGSWRPPADHTPLVQRFQAARQCPHTDHQH